MEILNVNIGVEFLKGRNLYMSLYEYIEMINKMLEEAKKETVEPIK